MGCGGGSASLLSRPSLPTEPKGDGGGRNSADKPPHSTSSSCGRVQSVTGGAPQTDNAAAHCAAVHHITDHSRLANFHSRMNSVLFQRIYRSRIARIAKPSTACARLSVHLSWVSTQDSVGIARFEKFRLSPSFFINLATTRWRELNPRSVFGYKQLFIIHSTY